MRYVFDTSALLVFYMGEAGAEHVALLLKDVMNNKAQGYMNVVNLAELNSVIYRKNKKIAEEKERTLRSFGLRIVQVKDGPLWREAAMLMSEHHLSLGDAFAAATAKTLKSTLVTGDLAHCNLENIQVEWIGKK